MKVNNTADYTKDCLYFTVNSLARYINEMTESAFENLGISASYGHLMLLIIDNPNLTIGELSKRMNLKPSTMTRFIDKLETRKYITKETNGRNVLISPTQKGTELKPKILEALKVLYNNYCELLGEDFAKKITEDIYLANLKLEK